MSSPWAHYVWGNILYSHTTGHLLNQHWTLKTHIECLSVTSRYHDTKIFCSKQTLVIRRHWVLRLCLVELTLIISITTSLIIWKTALIEAKDVLLRQSCNYSDRIFFFSICTNLEVSEWSRWFSASRQTVSMLPKATHSRLVCVVTICVHIHNIVTVVSVVTPVVSAGSTISEMPLPRFIEFQPKIPGNSPSSVNWDTVSRN